MWSSGFQVFFVSFLCPGAPKSIKMWSRGPSGTRVSIETQKKSKKSAKNGLDFEPGVTVLGSIWETFRNFFAGVFLMFFGDVPFSLLGAIWAPKAPERVPKGSPK